MNILNSFKDDDVVLCQDGQIITKSFFNKYVDYIADLIDKKIPSGETIGVKSDNNALGLALIIAVIKSGRNALPLSTFTEGPVNDYLITNTECKYFIGYGTEIDHSIIDTYVETEYTPAHKYGGVIGSSSGSTGLPKITLSTPVYESIDDIMRSRNMVISRIGEGYDRVFYSPPMMSGCMVYFYMMLYGISIYCTNQRPTTELINDIVSKNNIKMISLRPTMIDRFISEKATTAGAEVIVSSGAPITKEQVEYCRDVLGVKHILDFYATTEAGLIAVRDAISETEFETFPEIDIISHNDNGLVIKNNQILGFWDNKVLKHTHFRFVDDIIESSGTLIKLLGRKSKKIKVSGFSVPSELVRQSAMQISGIRDCKVFAEGDAKSSDILKLEYTGKNLNTQDIINAISKDLPFYCVPKKVKYTPEYYWGVAK